VRPRVAVAEVRLDTPDGTFEIGRDAFPLFKLFHLVGIHIQSDRVRPAHPEPAYVETALAALAEACVELEVPEASVAFVDTVEPPPERGLRFGFKGAYTTEYPGIIWVFANWTPLAELRTTVRHETAHLAFARTHTAAESEGHAGPSEDFALAFEKETGAADPPGQGR
jgi:hypothetical protein